MTKYKRFHHMRAHYSDEWTRDKTARIQEFFSYNTKIARLTTRYITVEHVGYIPVYTLDLGYYFNQSKYTEKQLSRWIDEMKPNISLDFNDIKNIIKNCECWYDLNIFTVYNFDILINVETKLGAIKYDGKSTFTKDYYIDEIHDYGL